MKIRLYALLLEDVLRDSELIKEILINEGFEVEMDLVDNEKDYVSNLKRHNYDIIFADYTLPGFSGQTALHLARELRPNVPFIFISGTIGEDRAVELLKQGATDYVLKDRMERLCFATKRALDATEQLNKFRKTEFELQTNRELLNTIINNAQDIIYIKDTKGRYLLLNETGESTYGVAAKNVIGKDDSIFFSGAEVTRIFLADKKVIESGAPFTYEEEVKCADGINRTFHTIKCPMFDNSGNPTGLFGISRDISEIKQMESFLTESIEKAEESNRLKTAFLNNISHEIRTPMNAIIGFSDFLKLPDLPDEKRDEYIDIISNNCYQLLDTINDIVITASLASGKVQLNVGKMDINTVFKSLYDQFEPKAGEKNISLTFKSFSDKKGAGIVADEIKLNEILAKLIDNGIKFTKQGKVNYGCRLKDNWLEFYVEDTGIGIPSEKQELIFERFRQAEKSTPYDFGGAGMGLTIAKGYTELMGGKIRLSSEIDKGSLFYFTVPYYESK